MKKTFLLLSLSLSVGFCNAQVDTISTNIYQKNGKIGIGQSTPKNLFEISGGNASLYRDDNADATFHVKHNNKQGYGYARTLHEVYEGATGDPYTEFRIRNTNDDGTITSWSIGADNSDQDKFFISNRKNVSTGASPSYGEKFVTITTSGKVGIGTNSPENALSIEGSEDDWPGRILLSVNNKSTSNKSLAYISAKAGSSENHTIFGHISETYTANDSPQDLQDFGIISSNGNGLIIGATKNNSNPGIIKFVSGQSNGTKFDERMRIDSSGNIGIGTSAPKAKLQVTDGDIFISDIEKGIIMKSPDGTCWRGTLDNSGTLNFTSATCPGVDTTSRTSQIIKKPVASQSVNSVSVYPNPTEETLFIETSAFEFYSLLKYELYSLNGQLLMSGDISSKFTSVNISELTSGNYLIKVSNANGSIISAEEIIKK